MVKHYIKYFIADEGCVINDDGETTTACKDREDLVKEMGIDILSTVDDEISKNSSAVYGVLIEYTIKPITKDPFA